MRHLRTLQGWAVAFATIGLAFPQSVVIGAEQPATNAPSQTLRVADIALGQGGVLRGQVVDPQGIGQAGLLVSVQRQGQKVTQLKTDQDGKFVVSGLSGGTYLVSTDGAAGPVRAWAPHTAPPSAANGLLLVPGTQTVRGRHPRLGRLMSNPGLLLTAAVVGTILAVAIDQNSGS